jgi:hypothetical protein
MMQPRRMADCRGRLGGRSVIAAFRYGLAVRRPSVTIAAGMLQKAGLIHYARGRMTVIDRPGPDAASCECYHTVWHEFARLLGPGPAGPPN